MLTGAYADLMFAFGHARLGDEAGARELLARGTERLTSGTPYRAYDVHNAPGISPSTDAAHRFLVRAFRLRIEQALAGQPWTGPLSDELRADLHRLAGIEGGLQRPRYCVDNLRGHSRILEPQAGVDPFGSLRRGNEVIPRDLAATQSPTELADRLDSLMRAPPFRQRRAEYWDLLGTALGLGFPLQPDYAAKLLGGAIESLEVFAAGLPKNAKTTDVIVRAIRRAILYASHTRQLLWLQRFVAWLGLRLKSESNAAQAQLLVRLFGPCLAALCEADLDYDVALLLDTWADVQSTRPLAPDPTDPFGPQLAIADARFHLCQPEQALPLLDEVEARIRASRPSAHGASEQHFYATQACAYIVALKRASAGLLVGRLEAFLPSLHRVMNIFTTATHYSRLHLDVAEAAVLAVCSESFVTPAELRARFGDADWQARRQALPRVRSLVLQWGQRDWGL